MFNTLMYPYFTTGSLAYSIIGDSISATGNPALQWLFNSKIGENPVVTPSATTQVVYPSAANRYLNSVTVKPVEATSLTVTPSTEVQTFSTGYYNPVTVEATA